MTAALRHGSLEGGYPLDDADPRHDPGCEWHWFNRCNCSQHLKRVAIVEGVSRAFNSDLERILGGSR